MNIRGQRHKGKSVAILGPGAVGGFLAALFWKNGYRVSCIVKHDSRKCIRESGIQLDSPKFGSFIAFPEVERRLTIEPEYLFITTKAPHLDPNATRPKKATAAEGSSSKLNFLYMALRRPCRPLRTR